VIAVAACEAALALALFVALYRRDRSLDASDWQNLRELGVPPAVDAEPLPAPEPEPPIPTLPPAGRPPAEEPARA
jgi:NADH-quinone oxidoreductase subunit K